MRISRALALAGIDSRRKCEVHVQNGAVSVNGEVVRDLGRQVNPEEDMIVFRGRLLHFEKHVYYLLFKPTGYTTTARDEQDKKTVYELLPRTLVAKTRNPSLSRRRVFTVGRLDKNSTGLLLFTNHGEMANKLSHPRYRVDKWYEVRLDRALEGRDKKRILQGVRLEDGMARVEKVTSISKRVVRLMLREGKKREVRRLFEKIGYEVVRLCRIQYGPLGLGTLRPGEGRFLTPSEIKQLQRLTSV